MVLHAGWSVSHLQLVVAYVEHMQLLGINQRLGYAGQLQHSSSTIAAAVQLQQQQQQQQRHSNVRTFVSSCEVSALSREASRWAAAGHACIA
jgi:hypothetical protein